MNSDGRKRYAAQVLLARNYLRETKYVLAFEVLTQILEDMEKEGKPE